MNPTKTFTITASPDMMLKIERFLAYLHYNTAWGHSATIAIDVDGDGEDRVTVVENQTGLGEYANSSIFKHKRYLEKNIPERHRKTRQFEYINADEFLGETSV